ncbi:MAG: hypothetical protein U0270_07995 [Labilithrix sp.]
MWSADKGTITVAGDYTAPLENTVAKVTATDGNGNTATATIAVGSAIAISQDSEETFPKGTVWCSMRWAARAATTTR